MCAYGFNKGAQQQREERAERTLECGCPLAFRQSIVCVLCEHIVHMLAAAQNNNRGWSERANETCNYRDDFLNYVFIPRLKCLYYINV